MDAICLADSINGRSISELIAIRNEIGDIQKELEEAIRNAGIDDLQIKIEELQTTIRRNKEMLGIPAIEARLSALRSRYSDCLPAVGQSITTWQPDRFTKGKKEVYSEKGIKILRSTKTVREIRASEFFETYPFLAPRIAKVTIKDAEQHVSKNELEKFCDKKITYNYEVLE